jgi:lysophospholipase L1-like esterase
MPDWARDRKKAAQTVADQNTSYPRLHQDYSEDGITPGPSRLAGKIFTSILAKMLPHLPIPSQYIPDYQLLYKYGYSSDRQPAFEVKETDYPPKTELRYQQKRHRAFNKAITKRRRLAIETKSIEAFIAAEIFETQKRTTNRTSNTVTKPTLRSTAQWARTSKYRTSTTRRHHSPIHFPTETKQIKTSNCIEKLTEQLKITTITTSPLIDYNWLIKNVYCIKVAIYGHSFVKHLEKHFNPQTDSKLIIKFFAISGGKIATPIYKDGQYIPLVKHQITREWQHFKPDLTVTFLGGNDITNETQPAEIVHSFKDLCENQKWTTEFIIASIENRLKVRENTVSLENYEILRTEINDRLATTFKENFWNLDNFWNNPESRTTDGVHLTETYNKLLADYTKNKLEHQTGCPY